MRVLAHIHTFNDADIIAGTIAAVLRQTRAVASILLVDNASQDGTLSRSFPPEVTVIRNRENLGTSGAVRIGFEYALARQFDWIWVLDADSVPEPDALQTLLDLYESWPAARQQEIGFLACVPYNQPEHAPLHGRLFTPNGRMLIEPKPDERYYGCHVTIWSGCLYRLSAVRRIGLPNQDYVLDRGELEYAYRVMKRGYKGYMHRDAVIKHNIRGSPALAYTHLKLGPVTLKCYELPPIRVYYTCRNTIYFTLYDFAERRFSEMWRIGPSAERPGWFTGVAWRVMLLTVNFLLRPRGHARQIAACFRGIWHGLTGNIAARY